MSLRIVIALPSRRNPLSIFVGASLLFHMTLAVGLIVLPFAQRRAAPPDSLVVELAGPLPGPSVAGSAAPAAAAPVPPAPEPPAPKSEPVPTLVPDQKKKETPPKIDKNKKEEPRKEKTDTRPAPPSPPPAPGPQSGGSGSGTGPAGSGAGPGGGGGISALDIGDVEFAWYRASVTAALRSHWVRPILEGTNDVLSVTIAFEVRRDGTVTNLRVEGPSGVPSLDRSALRAVADASPLPPIPSSWPEPTLKARYFFEWTPGQD